jgi:2,3-bisphosphoglycerate-independent phosphoglycerate mutase
MPGILLVILDGLGDRQHAELGGLTPLEAACTPALDALAAAGVTGLMWPLGPGRAPSSPLAHAVLFGFEPDEFPGRGLLEAYGEGLDPAPGDIVCRANFVNAQDRDGVLWIAQRPDPRELPVANADADLDVAIDGVRCTFTHTGAKQGLLTLSCADGPLSHEVTDADPLCDGVPVRRVLPLAEAADTEAASRTAETLNAWMLLARERLAGCELNAAVVKWAGSRTPLATFTQRTGLRGATLSSGPLYAGLAGALGLTHIDAGDDRDAFLVRVGAGIALLDGGKTDFVHVHTKWPDQASHRKSCSRKVEVIEALDTALAPHLERLLSGDLVVAVTADHATPCSGPLYHSGEAVPVLLCGGAAGHDDTTGFSERDCLRGALGHIAGRDLMPLMLNAADRTAFLAERYSAHRCLGTADAPSIVPLRLR